MAFHLPDWVRQVAADAREMIAEQFEYRELLYRMAQRDLLIRYKQTVLGFLWAIFMPLINTLIFSVIFTRVARIDTHGIAYPVYAFCGLLAWNFFSSSLRFSVTSLTHNTSLVTKVYFPREIFPFAAIWVGLVDFCVGSLVLAAFMAYYGVAPHWTALALPLIVCVQMMFTAGIALLLAMANLFYRDVKYLFEVTLTVWMFATSVVYPVTLVKGRTGALLQLNPMTPIIDAYRAVLLRGELPGPAFGAAVVLSIVTFALGWLWFHRAEFTFAENI
ncbi:MAG: ABC transporter permease [Acidobacteria bacterium]|nr:ABC transporter permease [Acidobacteriota bacterium]